MRRVQRTTDSPGSCGTVDRVRGTAATVHDRLDISKGEDGDGVSDGASGTMGLCARETTKSSFVCRSDGLRPFCSNHPFSGALLGRGVVFGDVPAGSDGALNAGRVHANVEMPEEDLFRSLGLSQRPLAAKWMTSCCPPAMLATKPTSRTVLTMVLHRVDQAIIDAFTEQAVGRDFMVDVVNDTATVHTDPPRLPSAPTACHCNSRMGH